MSLLNFARVSILSCSRGISNAPVALRNLRVSSTFLTATSVRNRANYYREKGIRKWIRYILVRYPRSPIFVSVGLLAIPAFYQIGFQAYMAYKLPRDDLIDYRNKYQAVLMERLRFGKHLYIPFFNKNIATEQDEETQKVFMESTARPSRTSIY